MGSICQNLFLTAGFWGLTPRRHKTSPLSLSAQTGICSILLCARHGIREMSLRVMGGTCCHGLLSVILHFLHAEYTIIIMPKKTTEMCEGACSTTSSTFCASQSLSWFCGRETSCRREDKSDTGAPLFLTMLRFFFLETRTQGSLQHTASLLCLPLQRRCSPQPTLTPETQFPHGSKQEIKKFVQEEF